MHQLIPWSILLLIAACILLSEQHYNIKIELVDFVSNCTSYEITTFVIQQSMMHAQHSRARLKCSWGAGVVRPSRSTSPPKNNFCHYPSPPPFKLFWERFLNAPTHLPPLPPPKNFDRTHPQCDFKVCTISFERPEASP